jgi:two-component system, OmpR family, phosphate regulon sensor histidine kinase PhoR
MATKAQTSTLLASNPNTRRRTFVILFASFLCMIAAAAFSTIYATEDFWRKALNEEITRDLTQKAQMFATRVNTDRNTKMADLTAQVGQQAGARATVVDGNGKVLADSQVPVPALEKEGERPEFATALRGQTGIETRGRGTFALPVLYVAVPVSGGAVRLGYSLADVENASATARKNLWRGCLVAALAALIISALTTRMLSPR